MQLTKNAFGNFSHSFQSSPVPKDGCNAVASIIEPHIIRVSILTRPEGRVQPETLRGKAQSVFYVSILTRPEGRVQHPFGQLGFRTATVSILTRPEGRVQPIVELPRKLSGGVSILTRPEGRVQLHPATGLKYDIQVSILTRPEGRVQPLVLKPPLRLEGFQSSPVPKDGCNQQSRTLGIGVGGFNPHPSRRTGATTELPTNPIPKEFQSSPVPKDGCNALRRCFH